MPFWLIILVMALGVVAAFPLSIGVCALLGFVITTIDRLATECPGCGSRAMRCVNAIHETYPTGQGTGRFYSCGRCARRSFWSNDDQGWRDASDGRFDHWYTSVVA